MHSLSVSSLQRHRPRLILSTSRLRLTIRNSTTKPETTTTRSSLVLDNTTQNTKWIETPSYSRYNMRIKSKSTAVPINSRTVSSSANIHRGPHSYSPMTSFQRTLVEKRIPTITALKTGSLHLKITLKNGRPLLEITKSIQARLRLSHTENTGI